MDSRPFCWGRIAFLAGTPVTMIAEEFVACSRLDDRCQSGKKAPVPIQNSARDLRFCL